jgi:ketosteroid isomerase-like protein
VLDDRFEVIREATRRFNENDMDGFGRLLTEDAVAVAPQGWPEPGPFEGRDAVIRQFTRLREDWGRHMLTHRREEIRGDWILVELHWQAEGSASGVPLEMTLFGALRLKRNQVAEARYYWSWEEALADVGLEDEAIKGPAR